MIEGRTLTAKKHLVRVIIHVRTNIPSADMSFRLHLRKQRTMQGAWLLISTLIVIPSGGHALGGLLLCLEGAGRVEFEFSTKAHCSTDPESGLVESVDISFDALSATDDHCRSCLDIPLLRVGDQDCGALQPKPVDYPQLVGHASFRGIHTLLPPAPIRVGSCDFSSRTFAANLSEVNSVVLLI